MVVTLFVAGVLTILLPCILPLLPIVLGVSIAGRHPLRPLCTVLGMLVSFVGFTFLLLVVLSEFVELAEFVRVSTYYVLLLFGVGFLTHHRTLQLLGAVLGGFFFRDHGWIAMTIAQTIGATLMELGGKIANAIQQIGFRTQEQVREGFGRESLLTAFLVGLTMGLVWLPCAGPALGFVFTLVREEPGPRSLLLLATYGAGTAVPLLFVGYGGQRAVQSVRTLGRFTGVVKQVAGVLLILTAVGLQYRFFERAQVLLLTYTNFGNLSTRIEAQLFEENTQDTQDTKDTKDAKDPEDTKDVDALFPPSSMVTLPSLPEIILAPEFRGLGPWHNSPPLTLAALRGKVVLIDFWTYSCINCIRTLPYIQGYWEKFKDKPFVIIGVHSPEFIFEKSERNVADAIHRHGLTYPVAQDNNFQTWRAFANRYWPAKYLIDAEGVIRYTHFGEGAYEETDLAIQSLLAEMGVGPEETKKPPASPFGLRETSRPAGQTSETYLGARSWQALANAQGEPSNKVLQYEAPPALDLHTYALVGTWQLQDDERQVLRSATGEIRLHFLGAEANLVLGIAEKPVTVDIEVDGGLTQTLTIDHHDLYRLFSGDYGEHEVVLRITGAGLEGYAFTFGA